MVQKNIARVRNCPDVATLNSLLGLCLFVSFVSSLKSHFFVSFVSSLKSHSLCQNSKVAVTHSLSDSVAKVRYRAARAAKNKYVLGCGYSSTC